MQQDARDATRKTIEDFGAQWQRYTWNTGYYGSLELFADILGPLLDIREFAGARVADIGSGTGRVVMMLLRSGASRVAAVEPSEAMAVLRENTREFAGAIDYLQTTGEGLPADTPFDFVTSLGVLHHIPDPAPVAAAAYRALKPGGRFVAWLYGAEGNGLYLRLVTPLRRVTRHLPDKALEGVCRGINILLSGYIALCKVFPLPMRAYMLNQLDRFDDRTRMLAIFDQLNPAYAKYYTAAEARALFEDAGFADVRLHHRHGYSWTVVGTRPA